MDASTTNLNWNKLVAEYQNPDLRRSLWQVVNTFGPYIILWYLMYRSLEISYWLTLALAIPAGGFLVRTFIILHDCGHGSFFKSQRANNFLGVISGIFTFTAYFSWRHGHAQHHATSGDLDRRIMGDVQTLTVREYMALSPIRKLGYRLYRNPILMLIIAPTLLFLFSNRIPVKGRARREIFSVHFTNAWLLALGMVLGYFIGFKELVLVQLPIVVVGATVGVWLFYVQHQFEDTYWREHPEWQYVDAALVGSSYYQLPKLLQWFSGNIGFHHIHHLSPRIPNYNLEKCFRDNPLFQQVTTINFWESFKTISLKLWDEQEKKLVGFAEALRIWHLSTQTQTNPQPETF